MSKLQWQAASAKCLLTGEHSILHEAPALCIPVPLATVSHLQVCSDHHDSKYLLESKGTCLFDMSGSIDELEHTAHRVNERYENYLQGKISLEQVLTQNTMLAQLALFEILRMRYEDRKIRHSLKVNCQIKSTIALGSGLGSSAALIASLLKHAKMPRENLEQLALKLECYQHGHSSGLDLMVSLYKKMIVFKQGQFLSYKTPHTLTQSLLFIHTGQPMSQTGQCVEQSKQILKKETGLLKRFSLVSEKIIQQIRTSDFQSLGKSFYQNQLLLEDLGVVPQKVQKFLAELYTYGLGGKISGAGTVQGDQAGLVVVQASKNKSIVEKLVQKYGYKILSLQDSKAHVLSQRLTDER